MTKQTYRFIILLLTGLLALVITWGISFSQDNSEELVLPNSLENIYPLPYDQVPQQADRKSTRLNSSHSQQSRMPSSA